MSTTFGCIIVFRPRTILAEWICWGFFHLSLCQKNLHVLLAQLQSFLYLHPHSPLRRLFAGLTLVTLILLLLFPLLHTRLLFPLLQFLKIQFYLSTSTPTLYASLFYFACVPMYTYYTHLYSICKYVHVCLFSLESHFDRIGRQHSSPFCAFV